MFPFTVYDLLGINAVSRPQDIAIVDGEREISYGELAAEAGRLAALLARRGVQRGDRVVVNLRKSAEEIAAVFAAARLGAVFVNVYSQSTLEQIFYIIDNCSARALITDAARLHKTRPSALPPSLSCVVTKGSSAAGTGVGSAGESDSQQPHSGPSKLQPSDLKPRCGAGDRGVGVLEPHAGAGDREVFVAGPRPVADEAGLIFDEWIWTLEAAPVDGSSLPELTATGSDLAAILYTSGSTGKPKGVMLSNANLLQGARSVASYLDNRSDDRIASYLQLCFDYGLNQLTTAFLVGATVVLHAVAMEAELVKTLVEKKVSGLAMVAPAWTRLVNFLMHARTALPDLRYITNSGGAIPSNVLEAMPEVFPGVDIYLMYGLTEAFRSTYLPPELFSEKMGSMGKAVPDAEVFVIDEEKGLCGPGEQGELLHRGPLVSLGYWNDEAASAAKIKPCPQLAHLIGDEKVCYSGDIVRIDEDGFLWFVARNDSLIKVRGIRVSPTEVEDALYKAEDVVDAVAFGVADEEGGQTIHAAVALRAGCDFDERALAKHCRANMPAYMVPACFHLWPGDMPRGATGKLVRPRIISASKQGGNED